VPWACHAKARGQLPYVPASLGPRGVTRRETLRYDDDGARGGGAQLPAVTPASARVYTTPGVKGGGDVATFPPRPIKLQMISTAKGGELLSRGIDRDGGKTCVK
jgi:hypothetical protein